MKRKIFPVLAALCLVCSLLFTGCGAVWSLMEDMGLITIQDNTGLSFRDMTYTRPDMVHFREVLESSCETARTSRDLEETSEAIWAFYDIYDRFYTDMNLADIHYCADLTDSYWKQEYNYCMEQTAEADAGLDALYYALAESPVRAELEGEDYFGPGFFDDYEGETIWDETFTSLMNRESELVNRYYDLSGQALDTEAYSDEFYETTGRELAELFVELVALRQEIADTLGYDSYPQFAYDFNYYRDYTPEEALAYTEEIRKELAPLYRKLRASGSWNWQGYTEDEIFRYVQSCALAMGGSIRQCFSEMASRELYDISFGENKYPSSFEIYLYSYQVPYVFVNPNGSVYDPLTFVHEFGHYCSDRVCGGSSSGADVAEVFSQGMEYLSLCYGEKDEQLRTLKMLDCLSTYVEQAAYASFEQQVYGLRGEDLTVENVQALYARVGADFGFSDWDSREYVTMPHWFTSPMYIVSYVVSNDAAFQLYQLEQAEKGAGLARYQENLRLEESYFLSFVEAAGLQSPFTPERVQDVRKVLEAELIGK